MKKIKRELLLLILILTTVNFACNYNSFEKPNTNAAPSAESKEAVLESDLQGMRNADLKYIFVFRRKDSAAFDGEDKKYLRTNLPMTNRIVLSDEGKAFIIGSNYRFPPENTEVLHLQFNVEDFSSKE